MTPSASSAMHGTSHRRNVQGPSAMRGTAISRAYRTQAILDSNLDGSPDVHAQAGPQDAGPSGRPRGHVRGADYYRD